MSRPVNPALAAALAEREKIKAEEDAKKASRNVGFKEHAWCEASMDKPALFRLMGKPAETRTLPWESKIIQLSQIKVDAGNYLHKVIFPTLKKPKVENGVTVGMHDTGNLDESHPFFLALKGIMKTEKAGKEWRYVFAETAPCRFLLNNKIGKAPFNTNWYPNMRVLMPVIDRLDKWCAENKHTKLLTSRYETAEARDKEGKPVTRVYADYGVGKGFYQNYLSRAFRYAGDTDIDFLVEKIQKGAEATSQEYEFTEITTQFPRTCEHLREFGNDAPLTAQEMAYEHYNLDEDFAPTSYTTLLALHGGLIRDIDAVLGTDYYNQMSVKAEAEREVAGHAPASNEPAAHTPPAPRTDAEPTPVPTRQPKAASAPTGLDNGPKLLPKWSVLTPADIDYLVKFQAVVNEKGGIQYPANVATLACGTENCSFPDGTRTMLPMEVVHCPVCGAEFE